MMTFERDPEEIGEEAYEDTELRMDVQQSIHTFDPGPDGRCRGYLIRHGAQGNVCGSTQRSSVFHDDEDAYFRQQHDHGGGDCMCFENEDYESAPMPEVKTYTVVLKLTTYENPYKFDWLLLLDLARSEGEGVEVLGIIPS